MRRAFAQVDVFADRPVAGNPVAVVRDGDGLDDASMAAFARWTNLSETTFLQTPSVPGADFRLRIFTPGGELPFAGHPTLGSVHAWLEGGGVPAGAAVVVECGIGPVTVRRDSRGLAFAAPELRRTGAVDFPTLVEIGTALGLAPDEIVEAAWVDNGPPWIGLLLDSGRRVLDVEPDFAALGSHMVGLVGPYAEADRDGVAIEVRAFAPGVGVPEDPVTGSLNAGLARWLRASGRLPAEYTAAQGTAIGRAGRVRVVDDGTDIWIGGGTVTVIEGTVDL
ncbi:PhzF family phenazine biosynthesis protein [Gordonia crocea]|uniref:Phenazine biosynthesis protein PhzF n=1 Tax=Gordonia crocea TaxID=589162 RepID=A0A7I9UW86_9ACTN|nr:PhzF family phenazine biosynthesis protein [Gordonia crocea]GED97031.1 phenazine biosynthesis protein PhzF [Gordonia crocea]